MPARRRLLRALIGPALAGLPGALAWSPGLPPGQAPRGPVSFDASTPGASGLIRAVALASGEGHVVAAIGPSDHRPTRLVELGEGKPPRTIRVFPRGAAHPTVGTDASGAVVVLVRTCATVTAAGKGGRCGIEVTDLRSGVSTPLAVGGGARVAAMDRGAVVAATGPHLTFTAAPASDGTTGRTTMLPALPPGRVGTTVGSVEELDLRDGVIAATVELRAAFGGSLLARYDARHGWTRLGVSTDGGAAIGHRAFYAPTVTATGVRAFFDGAEDLPGYGARWTTGTKPVREVHAAPLGNPVQLRTAAFAGDRLLVFTGDDTCEADACRIASFGPFRLG